MTTTAMPAGDPEWYARQMEADGYPPKAIAKAIRVLKNHLHARVHTGARERANTKYKNTNTPIDESGRMLDLKRGEPDVWVVLIIKAALKARGISSDEWRKAWEWFRSWNIDTHGKDRIAVRAFKKWLSKFKGMQPKATQERKTEIKTDMPDDQQELTRLVGKADFGTWRAQLGRLIAKEGEEEIEARIARWIERCGCSRTRAALAVVGQAELR